MQTYNCPLKSCLSKVFELGISHVGEHYSHMVRRRGLIAATSGYWPCLALQRVTQLHLTKPPAGVYSRWPSEMQWETEHKT